MIQISEVLLYSCIIGSLCMRRRITFQESSQTFGVCTSRYEYKGISGSDTRQQKPSASLIAPSITVSLGSGGGSGVDADSSSVAKKAKDGSSKVGAGSGLSKISHGELIEADSFLIVDQHTFEGLLKCVCSSIWCKNK